MALWDEFRVPPVAHEFDKGLNLDLGCSSFDFRETHEIALTGTWTVFSRFQPILLGVDVGSPKRPCAALFRPDRINGAAPALRVKERAISI